MGHKLSFVAFTLVLQLSSRMTCWAEVASQYQVFQHHTGHLGHKRRSKPGLDTRKSLAENKNISHFVPTQPSYCFTTLFVCLFTLKELFFFVVTVN